MPGTINTIEASDNLFVLGETLRPLLTNAMGSAIEIFDTSGPGRCRTAARTTPVGGGLRGARRASWRSSSTASPTSWSRGRRARAGRAPHGYRNVTDAHFLTIVTKGNAAEFFAEVANEVEMTPPDIPGVVRVAAEPRHRRSRGDREPPLRQPQAGGAGGGDPRGDPRGVRRAALRPRSQHAVADRGRDAGRRVGADGAPPLPQPRRPDRRARRLVRPALLPARGVRVAAGPDDLRPLLPRHPRQRADHAAHPGAGHEPEPGVE